MEPESMCRAVCRPELSDWDIKKEERKMKKRLVSLLLAVCMAVSFLPVSAFAEAVGETFTYTYEGQTLSYKVTGDSTVEV